MMSEVDKVIFWLVLILAGVGPIVLHYIILCRRR